MTISHLKTKGSSASSLQFHRIFRLLQLLAGEEGLSAVDLAARCGVTRRTVFRDLRALEAAGMGVYLHKATRRYRLKRDSRTGAVLGVMGGPRSAKAGARARAREAGVGGAGGAAQLTQEELIALVGMTGKLTDSLPMLAPLRRGLEKLRGGLTPEALQEVQALEERVSFKLSEGQEITWAEQVHRVVERAVREQQVLWCTYEAAESKVGEATGTGRLQSFDFDPYGIFWNRGACYVVGHHSGRDAIRTLRLSRFKKVETTDRRFRAPEGFSMHHFMGEAWGVVRGGKRERVILRFTGRAAQIVEEMHWHPSQRMERHRDGSLHFRCQVFGLSEIVRWALSFGGECKVLEPVELAALVREEAAKVVASYGQRQTEAR